MQFYLPFSTMLASHSSTVGLVIHIFHTTLNFVLFFAEKARAGSDLTDVEMEK
jgi:hypothetical protein